MNLSIGGWEEGRKGEGRRGGREKERRKKITFAQGLLRDKCGMSSSFYLCACPSPLDLADVLINSPPSDPLHS